MISIGYIIAEGYKRNIRVPIFAQLVDMAERAENRDTPGKGTFRFYTGILLAILLFGWSENGFYIAMASAIVLALGDSMSTLVGKKFGRHKIPYNRDKSLEGALGGAVYAFLGIYIYFSIFTPLPSPFLLSLAGASVGMLVESMPLKVDDNLTIPVFSALGMYVFFIQSLAF